MNSKKGSFLVFMGVLLWSLSGFIIKTVDASAVWITLIRSLSGGIFLSPFIFKEKIYPLKSILYTGAFMTLFSMTFTLTTQFSSSAMAISMQYSAPMYIIGYSFYKNKRIDYKKLIVLILIFIGIFLNILDSFKSANIIAMFTGLAVGITFVFYSTNLQKVEGGSPLGIVSLINLICSFFYILALPFNYTPIPSSLKDILLLCAAGILISGISYALYGAGLRKVNVEKAMIICLAEPILNPIWVFLGTKEVPPAMTIIGIIFILLGAVVDIFFRKYETSDMEDKAYQEVKKSEI